jgi:uncharacterized membrane protein
LNRRANAIAAWHALTNVAVVSLYAFSDVIRMGGAALRTGRWWRAVTGSTAGFLLLGVAGWLGRKLAYEERVGVVDEPAASDETTVATADRIEASLSSVR